MAFTIGRRAALTGALLGAAVPARAADALRIGYQKNGSLVILRSQGTLEALFGPRGIVVRWVEFPTGPSLLEALDSGSIDFGATGDTPPIFAQAAGADLLYVGAQPLHRDAQAMIVLDSSSVRTLSDLRGKRIAFTRGSSAHNLVVQSVLRAGLTMADIKPVPLLPADAAAAFRSGAVDVWAIWDPFLAIAQQDPATRVLVQAADVAPSNGFFLGRRAWVAQSPATVTALLDAINGAAAWAKANPEQLAGLMAEVTGVPIEAQRVAVPRGVYAMQPFNALILAEQQKIADTFAQLRIIPAPIDVQRLVWMPPS